MLDVDQFRIAVVKQALVETELWSQAAENLIVGTALVESRLTYLLQKPSGPGRGLYQFEEASYFEVIKYLHRKEDLSERILNACHYSDFPRSNDALVSNLKYATLMCRVFYWRFPEPLPNAESIFELAQYYCKYYNTYLGKSTPEKFVEVYEKYDREMK